MLDNLSKSLCKIIENISGKNQLNKQEVEKVILELQRALIRADVDVELVFQLSEKIKSTVLKENAISTASDHLITTLYKELAKICGAETKFELKKGKPISILLCGLFGNGKTTTAGKLALYFKRKGKRTALFGLDTTRPGAMDQIEQIGQQIEVPVFIDKKSKDIKQVVEKWKSEINTYKNNFDVLIFDTAGRSMLDKGLVEEIKYITKEIRPDYRFLVLGADIGQSAKKQAELFKNAVGINGVILTKMDSSAKGGGAITASAMTGAPVYFIGTGEKMEQFEQFNSQRFVSELLGYGDIQTLMEKIEDLKKSKELEDTNISDISQFDLNTFYSQMNSMKKLGPLKSIISKLPLFSQKIPDDMLEVGEEKLKKYKFVIDSCTKDERKNPEIINLSRIKRIAQGSGVPEREVAEFFKQFKLMKTMLGEAQDGKMPKKYKNMMRAMEQQFE